MIETTEILILGRNDLGIKTRKLSTENDYVLVDGVSLVAQVLVADNVVLVNILEDYSLIDK